MNDETFGAPEPLRGPDPQDPDDMAAELKVLRDEVELLRQRLEQAPTRMRVLEERLLETKQQLAVGNERNAKLVETLTAAREQLTALRDEVDKLSSVPQTFGTFLELAVAPGPDPDGEEGEIVDLTLAVIQVQGRKMRVGIGPDVDPESIKPGQEVLLNDAMAVVGLGRFEERGELATVVDLLGDDRVLVTTRGDEERVVVLADPLREIKLKQGDSLLVDTRTNTATERVPKSEVEQLVLEHVPDVTYADIGGLGDQVEAIRDAVELPYLHADLFVEHELRPPKGILLYGPPGCGKTMIAKAVANSLAQRVAEKTGRDDVKSFFLNIKGPELLNKYVGETERQIRLIFQRAREKAAEGHPVIVFFDEMESLFRTRGSGVSSDVETTIVPQLLAEIDGVEGLKDVVIIGASNREDMIDPAILRPGRLDVKIKVERPDAHAAKEIMKIYLHEGLPLHAADLARHGSAQDTISALIEATVAKMYTEDDDSKFLEVTYANGEKEVLYFKDFNSGAMIDSIVSRAKKYAIKRLITEGERGIQEQDLLLAIREEFRENEDLPNTTNPDDWARISGKKGERIVYIRTLISQGKDGAEPRQVENVSAGQYL